MSDSREVKLLIEELTEMACSGVNNTNAGEYVTAKRDRLLELWQARAKSAGGAVPEGWKVVMARETAKAMGCEGFLIEGPNGDASVWKGSEDTAENLLYILLAATSQQPVQRVKCSDRMPTADDGDCEGKVWYWSPKDGMRRVRTNTLRSYRGMRDLSECCWQKTGLERPTGSSK